jgi:excisionase family DNA binding protein
MAAASAASIDVRRLRHHEVCMPTAETYSRSSSRTHDEPQPAPGPDDLHQLLTVEEVAALLKVSPSWVYEHTRSRGTPRAERLPHIKIGKYLRFEAGAIRTFLERKKCRAT